MKIAVLDDYQGIALKMADWSVLPKTGQITVFRDHLDDIDLLADRLKDFEIISVMRERTPFSGDLIERLPNLKLLVTAGMFNAAIDLDTATRQGVIVCGTGALPQPGAKINLSNVAELTWGLILSCVRHIPTEDTAVRQGHWQTTIGFTLYGKVLGILGLGNLGTNVAAIGRAFGMTTIAWSQNLTPEKAAQAGVTLVTKDELFTLGDVISVHLKLSERTNGLVGSRELNLMKPTAYIINTSRGPIIQEAALIDALKNRIIAGAGLDVFDKEPLPGNHPFLRMDNVVLTPHIGYVTRETYESFFTQGVENINSYLAGKPIRVINATVLKR